MSRGHTSLRQGSKLTRDMMVMKAVTAWCCRVRSAAPEIHFPLNKEVQFSIHFCSILCIKYFLICKIKRYVIIFFVYKNRFLARQIGPIMASYPITFLCMSTYWKINKNNKKKQRWLLPAGFFSLADFPQKQQECFSEDHYWFISVDSVGRERSKLFQVVVLILEAAITFFLFKLQRQQCASLERCICIDI